MLMFRPLNFYSYIPFASLALFGFFCFPSLVSAVDKSLPYSNDITDANHIAGQSYFVEHFYAFDNLLIGYRRLPDMQLLNLGQSKVSEILTERFVSHQPEQKGVKTQDLTIFKSGKIRGTGILVDDYVEDKPMQIRMWMPALRKIRRFSEPALDDIWGGSHLTYGDLYLRRPEHETHQLLTLENPPQCLEDASSFTNWTKDYLEKPIKPWCELSDTRWLLLKSTPVENSPWYDYRLRWIDAESFAEYQVEYFQHERLVKRLQKNWHATGLADPRALLWNFWSVIVFDGDKRVGESLAWISDDSYQWNQSVDARLWSEKSLRQIKR